MNKKGKSAPVAVAVTKPNLAIRHFERMKQKMAEGPKVPRGTARTLRRDIAKRECPENTPFKEYWAKKQEPHNPPTSTASVTWKDAKKNVVKY